MRVVAALLAACAASPASPSAEEILRKALAKDRENQEAARRYTFLEREVQKQLDGKGKTRNTRVRTYDITMLDGEPYRRLVAINDKPLPPDEERKEQEKLLKSIEVRQNETEADRRKRLTEEEKRRAEKRRFTADIPVAYHLTLEGSEHVAGRDCYVIGGTPRAGYKPTSRITRLFPHLRGRLWIDKEDYSLVRAEIEVIDTISYGIFLARIHKGTKARFDQVRVDDEVWLPHRVIASATGRVGLVKKIDMSWEVSYRDYRKFQADSRIVSVSPPN